MKSEETPLPVLAGYDLPLSGEEPKTDVPSSAARPKEFGPLLLDNLAWYCQLRWVAAAMLFLFGAMSLVPGFMSFFGLKQDLTWPFIFSAVLAAANAVFLIDMKRLRRSETPHRLRQNLWSQILFDLMIVTVTVNRVGSIETAIAFFYLFHIVLSCIFLSRRESLAVSLISLGLFAACVTLENRGLLPHSTIRAQEGVREAMGDGAALPLLSLGFVGTVFLVVWFLTSRLASLLQRRERDLTETNERLLHSQKERMRFMMQTTHELKSPFAAIQVNTQLLLKGYCGQIPDDAKEVIRQIDERSHRLAGMVQEMLQLANLRSQSEGPLKFAQLDLATVLSISLQQVRQIAEEHRITLREEITPAPAFGVEEHLKVLFINLLKNAIQYSHPGGAVRIICAPSPEKDGSVISIRDQGIGVHADKLPKIFNEYYRTNEAFSHNKDSTGLGLAIVRHIAETHHIRIRVESAPNAGTTFHLLFPRNAP